MIECRCHLAFVIARSISAGKRGALLGVFAVAMLGVSGTGTFAQTSRPNIVLIMADDLGVEGLGCYGGRSYATPSLDRLADEGLRFTHAYSQPLCTNTRIQLMTGLYNHRNWIAFGILDPKAKTIGHWMSEAGYATCIAGKWQLQSYDPPDYPGAEKRRGLGMEVDKAGFEQYSLWHTGHTELKGSRYADPVILENGEFRDDLQGRYGPDVWVEFIGDYLAEHRRRSDAGQEDRPFFIYYPMALPHWPFVPTPDSEVWSDPDKRQVEDLSLFKDMVEYTDKCVGRVVEAVDANGFGEETLIVFFSDNGTHLKVTSETVSGRVAGGKGETTDAGTHVPLIARWPGTIEPGVNDDLIDSTDFLPTLREAAGRPIPPQAELDGVSFFPRLLGEEGDPRQWIFCHFDPRPGWDKDRYRLLRFARNQRFKLYEDGRLFDVARDLLEEKPIPATGDSALTSFVRAELAEVLARMAAEP